jgi:hypothetical protein
MSAFLDRHGLFNGEEENEIIMPSLNPVSKYDSSGLFFVG